MLCITEHKKAQMRLKATAESRAATNYDGS